jgi:hypothetical protein
MQNNNHLYITLQIISQMNKKGIIMWFILAGLFILILTSLGIYIGVTDNGLNIGLEGENNKTIKNITLESISNRENPSNLSSFNENNSISITKKQQNNS